MALALLALSWVLGEAAYDGWKYRSVLVTLNSPEEAAIAQLESGERWLESYYSAPFIRHLGYRLVVSRDSARAELNKLRDSRVAIARAEQKRRFEAIARDADEVTRERLARLYLNDFKDGEHRAKCLAIVQEAEAGRTVRANRDALQTITADFNTLLSSQSEDRGEYRHIRRRAEDLPPQGLSQLN